MKKIKIAKCEGPCDGGPCYCITEVNKMYLNKCLETGYAEWKIINIKVTDIIKYIESNISKKRIINIL